MRARGPDRPQPPPVSAGQPAAVSARDADPPAQASEQPSWGAPKIREKLRRLNLDVQTPAISTVHAVLERHGLVSRAAGAGATGPRAPRCPRGHSRTISGAPTSRASSSSPTTATAIRSPSPTSPALPAQLRGALRATRENFAFTVFERVFKDFGLPAAIRTDNGMPFACPTALFGLSRLAVWWLRLGIEHRAHQARQSAAERTPRAHAPDA